MNEIDLQAIRDAVLKDICKVNNVSQPSPSTSSFTQKSIGTEYLTREAIHDTINIYYVASLIFTGKPIIPQFFGYLTNSTWPLKEIYSEWVITFYKPWRTNVKEKR